MSPMNNLILFLSLKFSKITKSFSSYISLIMIFRTMMNIIVNSKYHFLLPYVVRKAFKTSLTVRCLIVFCGSLYQIKETKFSWWFSYEGASLVAQRLKNLPAMQETQVWSLGQKDTLEKAIGIQYSCLENSMLRGAQQATVHGVTKSQTWLRDYTFLMKSIEFCQTIFKPIWTNPVFSV